MDTVFLAPATIVEGRWTKNRYIVKERIGAGGVAIVYRVEDMKTRQDYALKVSKDCISLNREYTWLKKFNRTDLVVKAYCLDDLIINGETYYYILMEYIEGENLKDYCDKNKLQSSVILGIILILLRGLKGFHDEEYIVGDLKLENIMLDKRNNKLRIIDLGGVVRKGQCIKEFTPFYDRASWRCGERIAEASYDIFTVMMIFTKLLVKESLHPQKHKIGDVIANLRRQGLSREVQNFIIKGLLGNNNSLDDFIVTLQKLHYLEKRKELLTKFSLRERRINFFLWFSTIFFLGTIIFLFLI